MPSFGSLGQLFKIILFSAQKAQSAGGWSVLDFFFTLEPVQNIRTLQKPILEEKIEENILPIKMATSLAVLAHTSTRNNTVTNTFQKLQSTQINGVQRSLYTFIWVRT